MAYLAQLNFVTVLMSTAFWINPDGHLAGPGRPVLNAPFAARP